MARRKLSLVVIVGPTASGKSELAVRLAKKFSGEVISADSRQVYRGLDIGTGKISRREMQGVPHHLLDVADPRRQFSVAEFQRCAGRAIADIYRRSKLPFLVGGTAFWVDVVAYGLRLPAVRPNLTLRRALAGKNVKKLFAILQRLDPRRARTVEPGNPRRLIRAIEIAKAIGRTPKVERRMPYRLVWIGLAPKPGALKARITKRVAGMLLSGLVAETRALARRGISRARIREFGFEYRAVLDYLDGKLPRKRLVDSLIRDSLTYARRQLAWWRRNKSIRWLGRPADAERLVRTFIASKRPRSAPATPAGSARRLPGAEGCLRARVR